MNFPTYHKIPRYDAYRDVLEPGESVVLTEKLHGTNFRCGILDGLFVVGSRRNALPRPGSDAAMAPPNYGKPGGVYWEIALRHRLEERIRAEFPGMDMVVFGEIFGDGVQDYRYGFRKGSKVRDLRLFDIWTPEAGYWHYADFMLAAAYLNRDRAAGHSGRTPEFYTGPWDPRLVDEYRSGPSMLAVHAREGIVIRPTMERRADFAGEKDKRVIFKASDPAFKKDRS